MAEQKTIQTKWVKRVRKVSEPINAVALEICDDPPNKPRDSQFKYDELFAKMNVGQAVKCHSSQTSSIACAMREWIKRSNKKGRTAMQMSKYTLEEPRGRVWLL